MAEPKPSESGWTVDTLKEYIEKILAEKEKALSAALIAVKEENRKTEDGAEKRFELLNELRSGVATKDQITALEKVVDELKTSRDTGHGRGAGLSDGWKYFLGAITLILAIVATYAAFRPHP
jgi:hypothetical protein